MEQQFEALQAQTLYCQRCKAARPVRERLLLVLPEYDLHEYLCGVCLQSVGTRKVFRREQSKILIR